MTVSGEVSARTTEMSPDDDDAFSDEDAFSVANSSSSPFPEVSIFLVRSGVSTCCLRTGALGAFYKGGVESTATQRMAVTTPKS